MSCIRFTFSALAELVKLPAQFTQAEGTVRI
jgi:hypothetical protein